MAAQFHQLHHQLRILASLIDQNIHETLVQHLLVLVLAQLHRFRRLHVLPQIPYLVRRCLDATDNVQIEFPGVDAGRDGDTIDEEGAVFRPQSPHAVQDLQLAVEVLGRIQVEVAD